MARVDRPITVHQVYITENPRNAFAGALLRNASMQPYEASRRMRAHLSNQEATHAFKGASLAFTDAGG